MIAGLRRGRSDEPAAFMVDVRDEAMDLALIATVTLREWNWMHDRVKEQLTKECNRVTTKD